SRGQRVVVRLEASIDSVDRVVHGQLHVGDVNSRSTWSRRPWCGAAASFADGNGVPLRHGVLCGRACSNEQAAGRDDGDAFDPVHFVLLFLGRYRGPEILGFRAWRVNATALLCASNL